MKSDDNVSLQAYDGTSEGGEDEKLRQAGVYRMAEPDPLFDNDSIDWTPERRMMLAILDDAVACYRKTLKRPRQNPDILARQAEFWIRLDEWNSPFSFNNVCEALGLDPQHTRERLLASRPSQRDSVDQGRKQERAA